MKMLPLPWKEDTRAPLYRFNDVFCVRFVPWYLFLSMPVLKCSLGRNTKHTLVFNDLHSMWEKTGEFNPPSVVVFKIVRHLARDMGKIYIPPIILYFIFHYA